MNIGRKVKFHRASMNGSVASWKRIYEPVLHYTLESVTRHFLQQQNQEKMLNYVENFFKRRIFCKIIVIGIEF